MLLRLVPWLTVAAFLLPVAAGLLGTVLPAVGYFPALGGERFSLAPLRSLLEQPGLGKSVAVTLISGFASTLAAFATSTAFCAATHDSRLFRWARYLFTPKLAAPHAAVAIGTAFLLAPSGWLARLFTPWLTGWERPPDVSIVHDEWGMCMAFGLALKEIPFLVLMTMSALNQVRSSENLAVARSLGYGPATAWMKTVFPQVYPQIRLPVYAVLAFSLSVVDVAIILGPTNPPPLAAYVFRLFSHRDLAMQFPAAAGAMLQLGLVAAGIGVWRLAELAVSRLFRGWLTAGSRGGGVPVGRVWAWSALGMCTGAAVLGAAVMGVWSLARSWWFPAALPSRWTLDNWSRHLDNLADPFWTTVVVGCAATGLALVLVLGCLENEDRHRVRTERRALWLLYVPLLVPQIGFLFGLQVVLVRLGVDGGLGAVVWSHLLFVLPYVFLALADPWRSKDERYARTAACLGCPPRRVFLRVKLPMLLRPVLFAAAVGFAVSVAQYLPTVFAGAGRQATLTTEAVTLSTGADRRVIGVYAFVQAALPMLVYLAAVGLPGRRRE